MVAKYKITQWSEAILVCLRGKQSGLKDMLDALFYRERVVREVCWDAVGR